MTLMPKYLHQEDDLNSSQLSVPNILIEIGQVVPILKYSLT